MNEKLYQILRDVAEMNGLDPDLLLTQVGVRHGPFPRDRCAVCGQVPPAEPIRVRLPYKDDVE